jgi:hypothetical protein
MEISLASVGVVEKEAAQVARAAQDFPEDHLPISL